MIGQNYLMFESDLLTFVVINMAINCLWINMELIIHWQGGPNVEGKKTDKKRNTNILFQMSTILKWFKQYY